MITTLLLIFVALLIVVVFVGLFTFGIDYEGKIYLVQNIPTEVFGITLVCSATAWAIFVGYVVIVLYSQLAAANFFM